MTHAQGKSSSTLAALLRLGVPLAFVQVGATSLGVIDTAVVGRTTPEQLAAVGIGNSITFAVSIIGMGLVLGTEPLIAQAVGRGDLERARRGLRQGVLIALMAWPVVVLGVLLLTLALPLFQVDETVVPYAWRYTAARSVGLLPFLLYWAVKAYLQAIGKTRAPVVGVAVAIVVEIVLDVLLVFGSPTLGIPALGVVGAGIAHATTNGVRLAVVLVAARHSSTGPGWWGRLRAAARRDELLEIVRIGLPLGLQMALEVGLFAFAALTMGRLGAYDLAAHQVSIQIASVTFNMMLGLSSACAVVVGQRIGAGDAVGARYAGVVALRASVVVMVGTGALFFFGGRWLAGLLTHDVGVIVLAAVLLKVAAAFQLSDGLQAVASGALRGTGDTRASFVIHAVSHWLIGVPCVLVLVWLGWAGSGVWWGLTAGLTVAAALLVRRFLVQARRGFKPLAV